MAHLSEGARRQVLRARIVLNDAGGNAIAQSSELAISPGEFRSYDFSRGDLPLMGEPGTGRVQIAANIFLKFDPEDLGSVSATLELVDNSTGRTTALMVLAVQKIKEVNVCKTCSPS